MQPPTAAVKPPIALEGTNWAAFEIGGQALTLGPGQRAPIFSIEAATNRFRGNAACNQISGEVTRGASEGIRFKDVIATRLACPALDIETRFLAALNEVVSYRIAGDVLELLDTGGAVRVRMRAAA